MDNKQPLDWETYIAIRQPLIDCVVETIPYLLIALAVVVAGVLWHSYGMANPKPRGRDK